MVAGGHAAFNPEPIADFIDAAVLGDGEEAVLRDHRDRPGVEGRGLARAAGTSCCCGWPAPRRSTCRASTTWTTCPTAGSSGSCRTGPTCRSGSTSAPPWTWTHWPYPQQAAGAAGRDGARAVRGGDLPRLHPGLPVLPGRHDHPPGAGAVDHHGRPDGQRRAGVLRLLRGRPALAVQRRPLRDRRHLLRPGRAVRGDQRLALAAVDPGGRVQRRPWPRSCPATAAAPG